MNRVFIVCLLVVGIGTSASIPAQAAEENILVIRALSLDDVTADLSTLATLFGEEISPEETRALINEWIGAESLDWVDPSRPLAVVLPTSGIALGLKGFVFLLPVSEGADAVGGLGGTATEPDENGLVTLEHEDGDQVALHQDGYLVIGHHRNLVESLDRQAALEGRDLPPGSVSADVFLEPLAPFIQLALQSARGMLAPAEPAPANGEAAVADAAAEPMVDLIFSLLQDVVNNARNLQLSLELAPSDLVAHLRLVPKEGTTLDGLVKAQTGGLPQLARHVDPAGAMMAMAGQITYTEAFVAAVQEFLAAFGDATTATLTTGSTDDSGPGELLDSFSWIAELAENWTECYRGDFAATFGFDDEGAARTVQVFGSADPEVCRELVTNLPHLMSGLDLGPEGASLTVTENNWSYGDVQAARVEVSLPEGMADSPEMTLFRTWFGESIVSYTGGIDHLMISTSGKHADVSFRDMVDRVGKGAKTDGLTASMFSPLPEGPGVFGFLDLATVFEALPEMSEEPEEAGFRQRLAEADAATTRLVFGMRFDGSGVSFEAAMALELLRLLGESFAESVDEAAPEEHVEPAGDDTAAAAVTS